MTTYAPAFPITRPGDLTSGMPFGGQRLGVEFLTSLNHAIRTPLSGILGLSDLMMENAAGEDDREYLASIRSCAAALNDLLSCTLEYASHVSGAIRLEEQDFPLCTAIEAGLREAGRHAREYGSELETELCGGLERVVQADALHLRDAVGLITRVAIHSSTGGAVRFRASLVPWGTRRGELILEAWREPSGGVPAEPLAELDMREAEAQLARSFRLENLEIVVLHRLTRLMQGSLHISPDADSAFALRASLPLVLPCLEQHEELPAAQTGETGARPAILIADDNKISLRVMSSILSRAGFETVAVPSGQAVIDALAHRDFDLVLLDLLMPGMDGGCTTARIRQLPHGDRLPILGITAGVTDELRESCRRNGMDAILDRPVDAAQLVASVRYQLNRAPAAIQAAGYPGAPSRADLT